MRVTWVLFLCAAMIAVMAAGCGSKKTIETPGGEVTVEERRGGTEVTFEDEEGKGKLEFKGDEMSGTITTEEGTVSFGAEAKITEEELGLPFYPGAKPGQTIQHDKGFAQAYFSTPDSVDKVKAFYENKVAGVRTAMDLSSDGSRMVQMVLEEEGVQRVVMISRQKPDDETHIVLSRTEEQEEEED